jgi:lysophospholipase L1-like esterase
MPTEFLPIQSRQILARALLLAAAACVLTAPLGCSYADPTPVLASSSARASMPIIRTGSEFAIASQAHPRLINASAPRPAVPGHPLARAAQRNFDDFSVLNPTTAFLGDTVTANWRMPDHNLAVSGQRTQDMLASFNRQVLNHGYTRVVILAGTTDLAASPNESPDRAVTQVTTQVAAQIAAMARIARDAGIEPVLCTIPPILGVDEETVASLNAAIADLALHNHYRLVDFYTPMYGHSDYFLDAVHPSREGYSVMERALASAIEPNTFAGSLRDVY